MEDISRGAKSAGGKTVGVTYYLNGKAPYKKPNDYVDEEIVADSPSQRINIMLREADAFLVFPGGTGTLMELSTLLEYINKGLMEPKPIILFGRFWEPLISCLKNEPVYSKKMRSEGKIVCCADLVAFAETADECIRSLKLYT
jgi:predicted Rossmann-fold nucleotide-binding protein